MEKMSVRDWFSGYKATIGTCVDSIPAFVSSIYLFGVFVGQGVSYGKIYLFHFSSLMMVMWLSLSWRAHLRFVSQSKIYYSLVCALLLLALSSLMWNPDRKSSLPSLLQFLLSLSVLLFTPICGNVLRRRQLVNLIFLFLGVHYTLSVLETFNLLRWPLSPYSEFKSLFLKDSPQDYDFRNIQNNFFAPATSFFWNPNNCAYVTLVCMPLVHSLRNRMQKVAWLGLGFFLIYFSESRSVLVLFLSYILILVFAHIPWRRLILILAGVTGITALFLSWERFQPYLFKLKLSLLIFLEYVKGMVYLAETFFSKAHFYDYMVHEKIRERIVLLDGALKHLQGNFFLGRGFGFLTGKTFFYENRYLHLASIHNFWLELMIEIGLVGVFLFLSVFVLIIRKSKGKQKAYFVALAVVAIPVMSTARYFLFLYAFLGSLYVLSLKEEDCAVPLENP